jgi:hypothetical protein
MLDEFPFISEDVGLANYLGNLMKEGFAVHSTIPNLPQKRNSFVPQRKRMIEFCKIGNNDFEDHLKF